MTISVYKPGLKEETSRFTSCSPVLYISEVINFLPIMSTAETFKTVANGRWNEIWIASLAGFG